MWIENVLSNTTNVAIPQAGELGVQQYRRTVSLLMGPVVAVFQTSVLYFVLLFALSQARGLPRIDRAEVLLLPLGVFLAITIIVQFAVPWIALTLARVSRATRTYFLCWLMILFVIWGFDVFGLWKMDTNIAYGFWHVWTTFTGC